MVESLFDSRPGKEIYFFCKFPVPALDPTQFPVQEESGSVAPGLKCPGSEPGQTAKVKKEWRCNSIPPTCFHNVQIDVFNYCNRSHKFHANVTAHIKGQMVGISYRNTARGSGMDLTAVP